MTVKQAGTVAQRVTTAAEELFAEYGYQGCSLLRIAKAAGTSESGLLRFFHSKEDVFLAVIDNATSVLLQRLDEALLEARRKRAEPDGLEDLMLVLEVVFDTFADEPNKIALIFSEGGMSIRMLQGSQGQTLMTLPGMIRLVDLVTSLFASAGKRGEFQGIDPIAAREVFFGIIEGVVLGWLLSSDPTSNYKSASPRKILNVVRPMLRGLRSGGV